LGNKKNIEKERPTNQVQHSVRQEIENVNINWDDLRKRFFENCVDMVYPNLDMPSNNPVLKTNMAPHDLFEWFKKNIQN